MNDLFDNDDLDIDDSVKKQPFYKVVNKSKKDKLEWLTAAFNSLKDQAQSRTSEQRDNLALYRGISRRLYDRTLDRDSNRRRLNKLQKFVVNHLYDLTETKVSQITKIKPAVEVLPTNDEWQDRASAKVVSSIVKHLWYINNIDYMRQQMHRHARIFGESYLFITWDDNAGDLHPAYVKAKKAGLDSVNLPNGTKVDLSKPVKTGDVCYEVELPWRVLLQRALRFEDSEYCFRIKAEQVDKLQDKYKGDKLNVNMQNMVFDIDTLEDRFLEDHIITVEFWHKQTEHLPEGYYAKFTVDRLLEENKEPETLQHGELPFERLTDLDVPDKLNGVSRYETIGVMQGMYNNLSTLP